MQIHFVDVVFASAVEFYGAEAHLSMVMSFEAPDDPHIKWLYKWCHVWFKEHESYVCWFI